MSTLFRTGQTAGRARNSSRSNLDEFAFKNANGSVLGPAGFYQSPKADEKMSASNRAWKNRLADARLENPI